MTEQEWLTCADPQKMVEFVCLRGFPTIEEMQHYRRTIKEASHRQLKLYACACCRRIWKWLVSEQSRKVLEIVEAVIDGHLPVSEQTKALRALTCSITRKTLPHIDEAVFYPDGTVRFAANRLPKLSAWGAATWAILTVAYTSPLDKGGRLKKGIRQRKQTETLAQSFLVRDIFGNPFRPITMSSNWLTPTVLSLAQSIYDERAFDRLSILADALEEAGCDNTDILTHCRSGGEHVRGCWALDLVLGKK